MEEFNANQPIAKINNSKLCDDSELDEIAMNNNYI